MPSLSNLSLSINRLTPVLSSLWTPSELSNVVFWGDASDASTITSSGGTVSQWDDKSGNDNHAVQSNSANRPETGVATLNSLNTISIRDSNKYMTVTNTPTSIAFYGVVNLIATDASTVLVLGSNIDKTSEFFFRRSTSTDVSFDGTGLGEGKYSLNGSTYSSFSRGHTTPTAPNSGGHIITGVFQSSFALHNILNRVDLSSNVDGHGMCELVASSTELSLTDLQKLEGYFAHKWGLTSNLPGAHPYKSSAPEL